jgi:antitoxin ParD1/3/4
MPGMDGLTATHAIRRMEADRSDHAETAGAHLHVRKPITDASLLAEFQAGLTPDPEVDKPCQTPALSDEEADMATMNISLPDPMKAWVEEQAKSGRYANTSDVVRDLIRREQVKADKIANMQRLIDEGRASGISDMTMADIRAEALSRIAARRKAG